MPRNWLRPLFEYAPASGENLFEIQLSTSSFADPYTIYTTGTSYKLDADLWSQLRVSVNDQPINVTVRAMTVSSSGMVQLAPSQPAQSSFTIAPVDAPGKIVYWAIPNGSQDGILRGFGIGEESVEDVLTGPQVQPPASSASLNDGCIGCHSATPDGLAVGFAFGPHDNNGDTYYDTIVDIEQATLGTVPSYVNAAQLATIRTMRGIPAFSRSHWTDGDHIVLLMDGQNHGDLDWVQLDAEGAQGTLARTGDANGATEPTFSHDGTQIVYVSTQSIYDGRLAGGPAALYTVPYGNRAGGASTPLAGASDSAFTEYYPAFSPDDHYVAFTRIVGSGQAYSNNQAEVFVVDAAGGQALRLGANDPPACQTSEQSPGVTNDWSKWSPETTAASNGKTYYWMTFSSTRSGRPQLFLAPMTVSAGAVDVDYPALYLWNQPSTDDNHTPSWDDYRIPPIVIDVP
jgi:Tol biopolymer transport system component